MDETSKPSNNTTANTIRRRCIKCGIRMSNVSGDSHLECINCRGISCNLTSRCNHCNDWTKEQMTKYLKHQSTLLRRRKSRTKVKTQHPNQVTGLPSEVEDRPSSAGMFSSENTDDSDSYSIAGNSSNNQMSNNFFEEVAELERHINDNTSSDKDSNNQKKQETDFQKTFENMMLGMTEQIGKSGGRR